MDITGNLIKMKAVHDTPVHFTIPLGDSSYDVNAWLGKKIHIRYHNQINCISCGAKTPRSYMQGYCYTCFMSLPQTEPGVLHPEKDQSHEGISRDMEWARQHNLIDHFVYLSYTSNLKVGVTRRTNVPTRWMDQGAVSVIRFARTPYRQLAGKIEVFLKKHVSDKSVWKKMLLNAKPDLDLREEKHRLKAFLSEELKQYYTIDDRVLSFSYPIRQMPENLKQLKLDKEPEFEGRLGAIKGQYLIFEDGTVCNVRAHNGYLVSMQVSDV